MKKLGILLLTCVLLLSLTACNAKPTDPGDAVVVEVGGVSVKKSEAEDIYQAMLKQTMNMYEQLGFALDETDSEFVLTMKTEALNSIAEQLALEQGLTKQGIGLTDEDIQAIDTLAQSEYNAMLDEFTEYYQTTREEAEQAASEAAYTLSVLNFSLRVEEVQSRLKEYLEASVTVSDDEILERYDALLEDQKESYEANATQYVTDFLNESIVVTKPSGIRNVKNIVISLPDDVMEHIEEDNAMLYEVEYYLYLIETELNAGEMEESEQQELLTAQAFYQTEFERLNEELATLQQSGMDQIRAKAEEVLALCTAEGADFDAIMAEYSADGAGEGMLAAGYPVAAGVTNYVDSFTEAAMALQNHGDISELVESVYGYHIIQYAGDVTPGIVPLEEVRSDIYELLLSDKKEAALSDEISSITEKADIKVYPDRL